MSLLEDLNEGAMEIEMAKKSTMQIKYAVFCYVEHWNRNKFLRKEAEFDVEPDYAQIEELLDGIKLDDDFDYERKYGWSALLGNFDMGRGKCKVRSIYAVVEKRYCREVEV